MVLQLSDYALLEHGGKVRLLTCACNPVPGTNKCRSRKCAKRGVKCVFGYCKYYLACVEEFQPPASVLQAVTVGDGRVGEDRGGRVRGRVRTFNADRCEVARSCINFLALSDNPLTV